MTAVEADQRRQRVPVNPDQRAARIARQPLRRAGAIRHNAEWDDECFMGGMLQSWARMCAVPEHGTCRTQVIAPHFGKYRMF